MQCAQCGNQIPDGLAVCPQCGSTITTKKSYAWIIILVIGLLLLCCVCATFTAVSAFRALEPSDLDSFTESLRGSLVDIETNIPEESDSTVEPPLATGDFTYDPADQDGSGMVYVRGYAKVVQRQSQQASHSMSSNPDDQHSELVDYVFFVIIEVRNPDFVAWLDAWQGNSFVEENAVGIGRLIGGTERVIRFTNSSDSQGVVTITLTKDETDTILNSSPEQPITLELYRDKLTSGGSDAPDDYSLMYKVRVVEF